jgi:hypothetical protein
MVRSSYSFTMMFLRQHGRQRVRATPYTLEGSLEWSTYMLSVSIKTVGASASDGARAFARRMMEVKNPATSLAAHPLATSTPTGHSVGKNAYRGSTIEVWTGCVALSWRWSRNCGNAAACSLPATVLPSRHRPLESQHRKPSLRPSSSVSALMGLPQWRRGGRHPRVEVRTKEVWVRRTA